MIAPKTAPTAIPAFAPPLRPEGGGYGGGDTGEGAVGDCDADADVVVVEDRCNVAVLSEEAIVLVGFPALSNRNLPTPVSQQLFVWSQQKSWLLSVTFWQDTRSVPPVDASVV